jgi:hypothetical protein
MAYDDPHFLSTDITRLDYFAAHAPTEIPEWFQPDPEPYNGPPLPVIPESASEEDKKMLSDWLSDPCWDLEGEYAWFQEVAEAHSKATRDYKEFIKSDRYLQWRWTYAELMLVTRELYVDPQDEAAMKATGTLPAARRPVTQTRRRP